MAVAVHRITDSWPRRDNAGLVGQARRAALSIPSNIAEGCGRASDRDFAKFIQVAIGSTVELEYQLEFAAEVGVMAVDQSRDLRGQIIEVRRMLIGLIRKLRGSAQR